MEVVKRGRGRPRKGDEKAPKTLRFSVNIYKRFQKYCKDKDVPISTLLSFIMEKCLDSEDNQKKETATKGDV